MTGLMSGVRNKLWKESSSVIIASKNVFLNNHTVKNEDPVNSKKTNTGSEVYNYDILVIKRSPKSSYMPSTFVFPGGLIDTADSSKQWLDLYSNFNISLQSLEFCSGSKNVENIKSPNISQSLSVKITAIRETFEECGLLLCKSKNVHSDEPSEWGSFLSGDEVSEWQHVVRKNPEEFVNLCKKFECYPDIWALQSWSNWLTPTYFKRRFNTAFFLVALDQIPPISVDNDEISEIQWDNPERLLETSRTDEISLPIPQIYELTRLKMFKSIESLLVYCTKESSTRLDTWMPVHFQLEDGKVSLFPGDYMYPTNPDYCSSEPIIEMKGCIQDIRNRDNKMNRLEKFDKKDWNIIINDTSFLTR